MVGKSFCSRLKGLLAKVVIEALNAFIDEGRFWMLCFCPIKLLIRY